MAALRDEPSKVSPHLLLACLITCHIKCELKELRYLLKEFTRCLENLVVDKTQHFLSPVDSHARVVREMLRSMLHKHSLPNSQVYLQSKNILCPGLLLRLQDLGKCH